MGRSKKKNKNKIKNKNVNNVQNTGVAKKQKGVIALPHTGLFPWQTVMALLSLHYHPDMLIKYHLIGSCLVYDARDRAIEFAIAEEADWIFFMDSDMVLPHDTIPKLVNSNIPIVSGIAFKRTPPFQPCFYTKVEINKETLKPYCESPIDFPEQGILECQGVGMACCLIRKEAWEKSYEMIAGKIKTWFFPYPNVGEDLSFCLRAKKAGIKMAVDLSCNVGHVSSFPIYKEHFMAARDEHARNHPDEQLFKEET